MGITFDIEKQRFQFDFEHDGTSGLVTLTGSGYQVEAFGKCFYYGYEFEPEIDSETRTKFIQHVKFSPSTPTKTTPSPSSASSAART